MQYGSVASMIALLNWKIASAGSRLWRCSGIFLISVSRPTQRNVFFCWIWANSCSLFIEDYLIFAALAAAFSAFSAACLAFLLAFSRAF